MDYVDIEELKRTLALANETFVDDDLELAITAASRAVDSMTGRRFWADEDEATRTYRPGRATYVEIDDLCSFTSIESANSSVDFASWGATGLGEYELLPDNAAADGEPWTGISLPCTTGLTMEPPNTVVRVTGRWGWLQTPDSVRQATKLLAARLLKRGREAPFGIAGVGVDGIAVRIGRVDPDVTMLVGPFARPVRLT